MFHRGRGQIGRRSGRRGEVNRVVLLIRMNDTAEVIAGVHDESQMKAMRALLFRYSTG